MGIPCSPGLQVAFLQDQCSTPLRSVVWGYYSGFLHRGHGRKKERKTGASQQEEGESKWDFVGTSCSHYLQPCCLILRKPPCLRFTFSFCNPVAPVELNCLSSPTLSMQKQSHFELAQDPFSSTSPLFSRSQFEAYTGWNYIDTKRHLLKEVVTY